MEQSKTTSAEAKPTDMQTAGLSGQVKQVKQICYKAHRTRINIAKGKIEREQNFSVSYNEKGFKTEEQFFFTGGWSTKKIYNNHELPVEETNYYLNGNVMQKTLMKYDEQGHEVEKIQYDKDENVNWKTLSEYDNNGNLLEISYYNAQGLRSRISEKFDDNGHKIESYSYDEKGLRAKVFWQYDDRGNILEVSQYNDDTLTYKATNEYKYDKQGNKLEYTSFNFHIAGTLSPKNVFRLNEHGDAIQRDDYDEEGNLTGSNFFTYEYDEQGNKINPYEEEPDEKLKSETEECEFDSHGNWIKKTTYYSATNIAYKRIPVNLYFREVTYWGEDSSGQKSIEEFFADVRKESDKEIEREMNNENRSPELSESQRQWLAEASHANEPFPIFRYYAITNNELPSLITYTGPYIEALVLLDELKANLDAQVIYSYKNIWNQQNERLIRYILSFPDHPGFLLYAMQIGVNNSEEFEIPGFITGRYGYEDDGGVYFSQFQLLCPSEASGKLGDLGEEADFARQIEQYINKCSLSKKPNKPVINMIEVTENGFVMREHAVDDDFEIKDLDVNYGHGFQKFHNDLMQRFNTSTKGLVLFHGQPGTGKTYYIRHLLRKMVSNKKVVIYMPPNMVDHLVEPAFMTFLSNEIKEWANDGNFCVLLIEDAEPLLAKRQEGVRIQGITNLLNMSDGILNDMLNLQIICTFNVDLKKLDSALLRPGRLVARKEFKPLSELDANLLAQRLGIKHHFTEPATLGEIYAMQKNKNTLIHDVEPDRDASTLIDDL